MSSWRVQALPSICTRQRRPLFGQAGYYIAPTNDIALPSVASRCSSVFSSTKSFTKTQQETNKQRTRRKARIKHRSLATAAHVRVLRVRTCVYAQPCAHVNTPITDFNSASDPIMDPIMDFDPCWQLTISSSRWAWPAPSKQSTQRCLLMRMRSK